MYNIHKEMLLGVTGIIIGLVLGASAHYKSEILTAGNCIRISNRQSTNRNITNYRQGEVVISAY